MEARPAGAVAVAPGGGAVRLARAWGGLPVADRSDRHRKRGRAAYGAYPRRSRGVRAFLDRGTNPGRTESRQATRPEAGAQAFALGRPAQTRPRLAGQGPESGNRR